MPRRVESNKTVFAVCPLKATKISGWASLCARAVCYLLFVAHTQGCDETRMPLHTKKKKMAVLRVVLCPALVTRVWLRTINVEQNVTPFFRILRNFLFTLLLSVHPYRASPPFIIFFSRFPASNLYTLISLACVCCEFQI